MPLVAWRFLSVCQRLAYYNLVLGIRFLGVGGGAIKNRYSVAHSSRVTFLLKVSACIRTLAHSKCAIKLRYLDVALAHSETCKTQY